LGFVISKSSEPLGMWRSWKTNFGFGIEFSQGHKKVSDSVIWKMGKR